MKEQLFELLVTYKEFAIIISITVNIIIALLAIVPSVFITAVNVTFFGFWEGMWISFIGEAVGAVIAFLAYRKGFNIFSVKSQLKHPKVKLLLSAKGKDAFILILWLRLLPFMPSGLVTMFAALGEVSLVTYFLASSLGKFPATLLEAYSMNEVISFSAEGKVILGIVLVIFMIYYFRKKQMN
ncbi:hypothetical protein CIB95_03965 [Lottiidibacillus patelloidae]|uniref:TVP38/TMEM64 family membrane protein n=1 Tax=Lottiidibacillus patelloidae TaxID=2670334 RepID=A0A263BV12_9BACI|nr:VTT domain-containing protein [Lottiidibacillus patelloidae]OZM57535.1 hypothetical protein CIB95_03965 [Lottiidibacillus patelloidae]